MHFVVVGGDAAGMSAASRARRHLPQAQITVLERSADVSYSACGMPYNIADPDRDMSELVVRQAHVFREKQGIDLRTGHWVEDIDPRRRVVAGTDGQGSPFEVPYDKLLIATGADPVRPQLPGIELPGVMFLNNLQDGRNMKQFVRRQGVRKAIIIGMGYIAMEICEALRVQNVEVAMVKPRLELLPWMNRELANKIEEEVTRQGVALHPGHEIVRIERSGETLKVVCKDLVLEGDMVLVAIGVRPNSGLAVAARLDLGPGSAIAVDRKLRTSDEHIYAAGDCADAFHVVSGERVYIPLALRANRAGWAVADNIAGQAIELSGIVGTAVFKVFDVQVARTGLNTQEALNSGFDPVEIVISSRSRAHGHPGSTMINVQMVGDRKSGRLLGVQMVGREGVAHRINAAAVALHQKMLVEEFSQCDLAYAPPFSPVWDPLLTASLQLLKKL